MSDKEFNLGEYMADGIESIVKRAVRATLKSPKESAFLARYAVASREAFKRRAELEKQGEHIPPFLIASITSSCNLHCAGCYARENHICSDENTCGQLSAEEWGSVFTQSEELGIGFILLAGGEPMMRRDVIEKAADTPNVLFPIFTNGTMMNDSYIRLFDKARNLVPIFSIEGDEQKTDERRGNGIYQRLIQAMEMTEKYHLLFGASVTVTAANIGEVFSDDFVQMLQSRGCGIVIYVEYVPVGGSEGLAPKDAERELMKSRLTVLRERYPEMLFLSFPGDEKTTGGCIAAGRGFFHINPHGGAEPCPFSPYSDINVRDTSVKDALHSGLFTALRDGNILADDHAGGCVLFEKREQVERLISDSLKRSAS